MKNMKLGISSYTYTWGVGFPGFEPADPIRPIDVIQKAQELGVKVIQFADNMPLVDQSVLYPLGEIKQTTPMDKGRRINY